MQFFNKKNINRKIVVIGLCITAFVFSSVALASSMVVIGNPTIKIAKLTKNQLINLYLGKPVSLSTHEQLIPYDQPTNSANYNQFYKDMLGWDSSQVSSYWSSQIFSGGITQPQSVANDTQAIIAVEQTPNSIAYVSSDSLHNVGVNQVKILYGDYTLSYSNTNDNDPYYHSVNTGVAVNSDSGYHSLTQASNLSSNNLALTQALTQELAVLRNGNNNAPYHSEVPQFQNVWTDIQANIRLGPNANNPEVQHDVLWFASHPNIMKLMLRNATPYINYVYQQIKKRNMPAKFALLPMVESGYDPFANSSVGAAGLWQLMPGTASSDGIDINWWYDQRQDIIASTNAALNFLVSLHDNLNTWYLAAAAYDAGQGAVQAAINYNKHHGEATDFWDLPLPEETRDYVPKLLALATIIKHPDRYGVTLPYVPETSFFVVFKMNSQMDLAEIAKLSGVSVPIIRELNPGLRRWATAANGRLYLLLIPTTDAQVFRANLAQVVGQTHLTWEYHEVRLGETLDSIAKSFYTSAAILQKVNYLKTTQVQPDQGILVPVWLNRTYENPIGVVGSIPARQNAPYIEIPTVVHVPDLHTINNLTASDLLSGHLPKLSKKTQSQKTATIQPMPAVQTSTNQPISNQDSLKTLIAKIYGEE